MGQRVMPGLLGTLASDFPPGSLLKSDILILGDCVNLHEFLDPSGNRPLAGLRVALTGTRATVAAGRRVLEPLGAEVSTFALIEIEVVPLLAEVLMNAADDLRLATQVVFCDAVAAKLFLQELPKAGLDLRVFREFAEVVALDRETAGVLTSALLRPKALDGLLGAAELLDHLDDDLAGKRVVLIGETGCHLEFAPTIRRRGGVTTELCVYECRTNDAELGLLRQGLASQRLGAVVLDHTEAVAALRDEWGARTARDLLTTAVAVPQDARTAAALRALSISTPLQPRDSTWASMAEALAAWCNRNPTADAADEEW